MNRPGNRRSSVPVILLCAFVAFGSLRAALFAQPAATRPAGVDRDALRRKVAPAIQKGLRFLENAQAPDGGWRGGPQGSDPAITAMAAKAFIQDPAYGPKHPVVQRALALVLKFQQPDGGLYDPRAGYANYSTSVALMTLAALKDPRFDKHIAAAPAQEGGHSKISGQLVRS